MPAPEPRTHYQVSFTSRQAVLLFVVVLVSLAGAYFLGLLTGLAGRHPADAGTAESAASVPTAGPGAASGTAPDTAPPRPTPVPQSKAAAAEPPTTPSALAAREPGTEEGLQFFEDQPEVTPQATTPGLPAKRGAPSAAAPGGWFVQVLSTTSEKEARSRRATLAAHGYRATVASARSPKGQLYRVRVGPYASRDEAARAEVTLARKENVKTWIVSPGQ